MTSISFTRRAALRCFFAAGSLPLDLAIAKNPRGVRVGAIRYDAWYDGETQPGTSAWYASHNLDPPAWQTRAPFFAKRLSPNRLLIRGTQTDVNTEIIYAANAGINFWAFGWYPANTSYRNAWNYYQLSPNRALVNWCVLIGLGSLSQNFPPISDLVDYFQQSNYERVGSRPLLVMLFEKKASIFATATAVENLRQACSRAGVGNPYILVQAPVANLAATTKAAIRADAIGCYAVRPSVAGPTPYSALDTEVRAMNSALAATGSPVIPLIMSGWDRRPQIEYPSPFNPPSNPHSAMNGYVSPGTPEQIATHAGAVVEAVAANANSYPAKKALMYSWNEHAEGGGICPTWTQNGPNTAILDALSQVIK